MLALVHKVNQQETCTTRTSRPKIQVQTTGQVPMIDEELYKIATDELNSDDRKPDVWARACALASDDHDEARFLYTNLRVEEMLNKDGKQRTFSATRRSADSNLSDADKLDTLELSLEDTQAPESGRTGQSSSSAPLPIDDILGFDENATDVPASVAGNAQNSSGSDDLGEAIDELDALAAENRNSDGALSNLTGEAIVKPATTTNATDADVFNSSEYITGSIAESEDELLLPETQRTNALSSNLQRQADEMGEEDEHAEVQPAVQTPSVEQLDQLPEQETIRPDYADGDILDDTGTLHLDSDLDDGIGKSYMVFSRNGAMKAIKRGVSWPALFFTFPWLLSKALFGTALIYGCLWLVSLGGLYVTGSQWLNAGADATMAIKLWTMAFALLALIGLCYIPFRYGNRWLAEKLQNRGFEFESAVSAGNKNAAVNKLLDAIG